MVEDFTIPSIGVVNDEPYEIQINKRMRHGKREARSTDPLDASIIFLFGNILEFIKNFLN